MTEDMKKLQDAIKKCRKEHCAKCNNSEMPDCPYNCIEYASIVNLAVEILKEQPQIVRCKDCMYWYPLTKTCNNVDGACCQSYVADDWFCADGKRDSD